MTSLVNSDCVLQYTIALDSTSGNCTVKTIGGNQPLFVLCQHLTCCFYRFVDFDSYNLSNSLTFGKSFSKHTLEVVQIPFSAVSTIQGQEGLILPNNLCNFRTRILVKHLSTSVGEPGTEWNAEISQFAYISIFLQSFFLVINHFRVFCYWMHF